jgi:hypothetical protein
MVLKHQQQIRIKSRPPSELALALTELNWTRARHLLTSLNGRKLAALWSTRNGFFDGAKDAHVLPLHQATAVVGVPLDLVHLLLQAYPAAVQAVESSYRRLPLHCACRTTADPALIQMLLMADADYISVENSSAVKQQLVSACLQPDELGRLPLHYALSNGAVPETIEHLLGAGAAAAQGEDGRGWTPLHVAASVGCSLAVMQQIYSAYPPAVLQRTILGSTPLQCLNKTVLLREQLKEFLKEAMAKEYGKASAGRSQSRKTPSRMVSSPALLEEFSSLPNTNKETTVAVVSSRSRSASHDGFVPPTARQHRLRLGGKRPKDKPLLIESSIFV